MKKIKLILTGLLLVLAVGLASAQNIQVTGTVTDASTGEPVMFASVMLKGTSVGVATDQMGKFTINAPANGILIFSFIGYTTLELPINGRAILDVKMSPDAVYLEDVLVVAYQTVRRSSFTGSAATVKQDQIERILSTNVTKSLAGAVPGVQVVGGSGQPGSSANIRIRGIGSVNASSAPLYVVDGAAYDGDINAIPTDDIESISVLKDAAAAALYGARGANGVIMVTTKKGRVGKATVNAKINIGTSSRAIEEYERVDSKQYYELMWEGWRNARVIAGGMTPEAAAAQASGTTTNGIVAKMGGYNPFNVANGLVIGLDGKLNPAAQLLYQDDWIEALSQKGIRQDYNVNVSGGVDQTTYYLSLGYINEKGHLKWSSFDRFTGRIGLSTRVNKWFKIDGNISGTSANTANLLAEGTYTSNPFYYGRMMGPVYPIYQRNDDGSIKKMNDGSPAYDMGGGNTVYTWAGHTRPYAPNSNLMVTLPLDDRSNMRNQLSARMSAEFTILKDLTLRVSGSTDMTNTLFTTYQNNKFGDAGVTLTGAGVSGRSTKQYTGSQSYTFNQVLTYNKSFGSHNLNFLVGHENYQWDRRIVSATRTNFKIDSKELVAGSVAEGSTSYSDIYTLEGYFANASYAFSNKYFLSGSYRYDGSSRFSSDSRWGGFWSVGASWRANVEPFMSTLHWLDDLRVKASYGEQGNDDIGNYYGYQSLFTISGYNNGNFNGAFYSQLANNELKWEKNGNFNVGVDFSLFTRVRGQVEYFIRKSDNLLFQVPLPQSAGLHIKWDNIGSMKNNGIEFQLAADIIKTKDFVWTFDINGTHYKNEITKMPVGPDGKFQEIISGTKKLSVGHSIFDFWLREWAGVDKADGSALYYKDIKDSEGKVTGRETTKDQNAGSYYYLGSSIPELYGGITNTVKFYGFDLAVFLIYQLGGKMYDTNYAALMHPGTFGSHMHVDLLNRWTSANTNTDIPRLQNAYAAPTAASSRWLTSASFLSLRNITLGYSVPSRLLKPLNLSAVRLFATGDNLAMYAKRKGMDPQQTFGGTSDHTYIPNKIISLGLNITF
ncbi:MAG: TonB-dependent receptor [Bacteroidales bacterium]|nr:TonB-dependent receptor [Bacteroidales bacterium]